ncbi:MAG: TetR family transcriptional regulator [Sphingomonadales bacterium]|nr:TetR family transcriptional regulator [Sphingomonadales bacterium]
MTAATIPAARRKRRSSEEIADLVLDAAAEEFEASGYAGATTAAIARRAGVAEAQIFRLYPTKQDLFRAAVFQPLNRHFSEFQSRNLAPVGETETARTLAHRYIDELQDFMARHSRMLRSLVVASAYAPETTGTPGEIEGLADYFDTGAAMMTQRVGGEARVDPRLMVRVSFAAVLASVMFRDWLFPAGMADEAAIRRAIGEFVIDGIRANQDPGLEQ